MACDSFFSPEIIQAPGESPFFRSAFLAFYPQAAHSPNNDIDVINRNEWADYFRQAVAKDQLSFLLYQMPAWDLTNLTAALEGKPVTLTSEAAALRSIFANYGQRNRVAQALRYLEFAKRVEPLATRISLDRWPEKTEKPIPFTASETQAMLDDAEAQIRKADKFIAQRYRFQVLRILFYSNRFAEVEKYFEQHKGDFTIEGSVKYRSMNLAGGAYYKNKKFGKADYLFSLVFDRFPALKQSAYSSFHPMEDGDWNETLALAKNPHERQVLWQLLGIYADGMAAIDKIYAMDPKSNLLPLLVVREVNIAEEGWRANMDRRTNGVGNGNGPRPDTEVVGMKRVQRIQAIADAGNTSKPWLWQLAAGYLFALSGDTNAADQYIRRSMKSMPDNAEIRAQARMSLLFARVRAIHAIDKSAEPILAEELQWLRNYMSATHYRAQNLHDFATRYLSEIYLAGGDPVRSVLLSEPREADTYRTLSGVDGVLELVRTAQTPFDKFLVRNYANSIGGLQELRGIHLLFAGEFGMAVEAFRQSGLQSTRQELSADPFTIHIKDCHECDASAPHTKYTRLTFAEKMLDLSQTARGSGQPAAEASFDLANGLYNMSWYGNGRMIHDMNDYLHPRFDDKQNSEPALNMDLAEKYYVQAASLSSDREFKSKALFMAAKTEQNRNYNNKGRNRDFSPPKDNFAVHYFKQLKDSYSDTQYYQEIIRECGRFGSYLK